MYDGVTTSIQTLIGTTESFPPEVDFNQRSMLSLFLFVLILNELSKHIRKSVLWCMLY